MGRPMAANVARAGFELTVCNRRPEATQPLREMAVNIAASAADTASQCEILFVCLPNALASETVLAEVMRSERRPDIYVELSTLSPVLIREMAARAAAMGMTLIDAPVSGNAKARAEGALTVMVGAEEPDFSRIRPALNAFARQIFRMGPVGTGSMAKVCNQLLVMTSLVSAVEGVLLGVRHGIDVAALTEVIMAASGAAWAVPVIAREYSTRSYRAQEEPRAALRLAVKDLELAVAMAAEVGLPTRAAEAALGVWREAVAAGLGDKDIYTLIEYIESQRRH
jgi:3-hydroxyisobutyrate dehydrogenase-like beta-hydroxyacid dehydrogenase